MPVIFFLALMLLALFFFFNFITTILAIGIAMGVMIAVIGAMHKRKDAVKNGAFIALTCIVIRVVIGLVA